MAQLSPIALPRWSQRVLDNFAGSTSFARAVAPLSRRAHTILVRVLILHRLSLYVPRLNFATLSPYWNDFPSAVANLMTVIFLTLQMRFGGVQFIYLALWY